MSDLKKALMSRSATTETMKVEITDEIQVTVRTVTRDEVQRCKIKGRKQGDDEELNEARLISLALVDPEMTEAEVRIWLQGDPNDPSDFGAPAGDTVKILDAIAEKSGLTKEYRKSTLAKSGKRQRR